MKLSGKCKQKQASLRTSVCLAPSPTIYLLFKAMNVRRSWKHTSIIKASFLAMFLNWNKAA